MDLSFRFPPAAETSELPVADLPLLLATLGERRTASATAQVQAALDGGADERLLAPVHGAFNAAMAARLAAWTTATTPPAAGSET